MRCIRPIRLVGRLETMEVPCGRCIACRIERTREWTVRLLHESGNYSENCFITLTYSNDSLCDICNSSGSDNLQHSLSKERLQLFFKRLRKHLEPTKIKYFACGEYGKTTNRPHYHIILFGWRPDLKNDLYLATYKDGLPIWASKTLEDLWPYGNNVVGTVTKDSIQYTAKYVQKKVDGLLADKVYGDRQPPFQLQSKGLGLKYCEKNADDLKKNLGLTVNGVKTGLPRYYKKKLEIDTEILYKKSIEKLINVAEHYEQKGVKAGDVRKAISTAKQQFERNLKAKINLFNKEKI